MIINRQTEYVLKVYSLEHFVLFLFFLISHTLKNRATIRLVARFYLSRNSKIALRYLR